MLRSKTLAVVVLATGLAGCGGAGGRSVASRCSDYGASYAKQVARRFPRLNQQRAIRTGQQAYCLVHARLLKMPSNPTDAAWNEVLKVIDPPAVTTQHTLR